MRVPGLSPLETAIMNALWDRGQLAIREIQEALPSPRPAYTTVQTMVYRLEAKKVLRRVRKIGNAHIFAAAVERGAAHRGLLDHVLGLFGGRIQPVMAHWAESGKLTARDIAEAEQLLQRLAHQARARASRKERKS